MRTTQEANGVITLIIDTSGSMLELGKKAGVLHLVCTLKQACKSLGVDFKVMPLKEARGTFKAGILLSDGLFKEEISVCAAVGVGVDVDRTQLKKISQAYFEPEEILNALVFVLGGACA
ncbi:hypothetical protein [Helicobacter suis]|uniref:VWFA domain-containing protein n=1 Tax=Helicobacter suis TaxID=104628 RepID=A0A6J4CXF9_9HELI|nr:hypothetical protein [Helicobacter suis]BCD45498.1 hypothetical protein NHP190020_05370 [Helicobacter suis]BCD48906.1 hypothetical protein NHP194004_03530 [Helicobacter suis]BCD50690.1 hypothetical protein NHP194022_03610 [Helicobacter suis]BCD70208.1 hypothetical protein SNTW_08530 [Helicobacter suis]BDR27679.1 hypothetical protein HSHS1_04400 [Helicobacter suis HS1]